MHFPRNADIDLTWTELTIVFPDKTGFIWLEQSISNPVFNFCLPIYHLNLHWNYLLSVPDSSENCSFILFNWTLFRQFLFECFFLYLTRVSINTSKVRRVLERWLTESSLFLQRTQVWLPAPPQWFTVTLTPVPEDLIPSSDLHRD